jgi:hypothetical protein
MAKPIFPSQPDFSHFEKHVGDLQRQLVSSDPNILAKHTGTGFQRLEESSGEFQFDFWSQPVALRFPDFSAYKLPSRTALSTFDLALLLYYFVTADGKPLSGQWISFSDLPDGRFYSQAFQSYSGSALARVFQNDGPGFESAAQNLGGQRYALGDAAYTFQALPRIPVLVVFWLGDEDFSASFQVLFDAHASHYLPTDAYAILGSTITRKLVKALGQKV